MENIISFSDWSKLDLRVAQIKKVEEIPGADKLWKLTLDVGDEIGERVVCARRSEVNSELNIKEEIVIFSASNG